MKNLNTPSKILSALLLFVSSTTLAAEAERFDFYGASDDGKYFAVTTTRDQDGSGITRARVTIFETAWNKRIAEITTDDEVGEDGETPAQPFPDAGSVASVLRLAAPTLSGLGIKSTNQGIPYLQKKYDDVVWAQNPQSITDIASFTIPKDVAAKENYVVKMQKDERPEKASASAFSRMMKNVFSAKKSSVKMCADLAPMSIGTLTVALTKVVDGKPVTLAERTLADHIADSNKPYDCAFDHFLLGIRQVKNRLVIIRGQSVPGFEGPGLEVYIESTVLPVPSGPGGEG